MKTYTLRSPESEFAMSFFGSMDHDEIELTLRDGITEDELRGLHSDWAVEEPFCEWLEENFVEL